MNNAQLLADILANSSSDGADSEANFLIWTILNRSQLSPGKFFSLRDHLYLIGIYKCSAKKQVYKKGGQIGISEALVSLGLYYPDMLHADVLYIMPTISDVSDFSQMRFGPALEASPYLNRLVTMPSHGMRDSSYKHRGADKVSLKRIRDNWLIFRGGTVGKDGRARQLKSVPADLLIADELDEMDSRTLPIARKRLGHSPLKHERLASTPTYPGIGIDAEWELTDQREWFVPCGSCGHRQRLLFWEHVVLETNDLDWPIAWHGKEENRAYVACEKCGKEIDRLAMGEWVPRYPDREVVGFHPTKIMAGQTSLIDIVRSFRTTDQTKRKEANNQHLGETFTPEGSHLSDEALDECIRDYAFGPVPDSGASMGIDVGDLLHVIIRGRKDGNGQRRLLYAGELFHFYEAAQLMDRYGVETCVVDAQPEKKAAREFQSDFTDGRVWLCYYLDGKQPEIAVWDWRKGIVNADRTWSIDTTMAGFYDKGNTLSAEVKNIINYYPHMKALIRVIEEASDGNKIARYINQGPDHFAHAENYCLIASLRPVGWAR